MFLVSKSGYQRVCYIVRNGHTTIPKMKARFLITGEKETCGLVPGGRHVGPLLGSRQCTGLRPEATSLPDGVRWVR